MKNFWILLIRGGAGANGSVDFGGDFFLDLGQRKGSVENHGGASGLLLPKQRPLKKAAADLGVVLASSAFDSIERTLQASERCLAGDIEDDGQVGKDPRVAIRPI